ncbi:MAG: hypothetical protein R3C01_03875 [Planctomycetaceae bacterium]
MNRRTAIERLLGGVVSAGMMSGGSLFAQGIGSEGRARVGSTGPQQGPAGPAQPGATGAAANAGAQVQVQMSPEVLRLIQLWEQHTRGIKRLTGEFQRYVYDSTFAYEKRADGTFWYENPDKGRIDIRAVKAERLPPDGLNHKKLGPNNKPYKVLPDINQRWICRGDMLILIDMDQSVYDKVEIPPHLQNEKITQSPLPFLFGMPAGEMEKRYFMSLGSMHNPKGTKERPQPLAHVVATPRYQQDAREWSRADVLLDPGTKFAGYFVPTAIRLLDPTGNVETVYVFTLDSMKMNETKWPFSDPFREPLDPRLKLRQSSRAEAPPEEAGPRYGVEVNRDGFAPSPGRSVIK